MILRRLQCGFSRNQDWVKGTFCRQAVEVEIGSEDR